MDNASFHKGQSIEALITEAGCELWYLPTYSPDLNKIEHWWFVLKNIMRQTRNEFSTFRVCIDAAFRNHPNVYSQSYRITLNKKGIKQLVQHKNPGSGKKKILKGPFKFT